MGSGLYIAALCAALIPTTERTALPWEEVSQRDGITIWQRHADDSDLFELRAEAEMPFGSRHLWQVLNDVEHYHEFMPYVIEARVLRRINPKRQIEYHLREPPLVSRRDYALEVTLEAHDTVGLYIMTWKTANDHAPPKASSVVRIDFLQGFWLLEPLGPNRTRVVYQNLTSAGSSLPGFAVSYANRTGLRGILEAVRERAETVARAPR